MTAFFDPRRIGAVVAGAMLALTFATAGAGSAPLERVVLRGGCALVEVTAVAMQRYRTGWYLRINGMKPLANMEVSLEHSRIGPGHWRTDVVGCTGGMVGLPIAAPYNFLLPVSELPGAGLVEIVGSNGVWRQRIPR